MSSNSENDLNEKFLDDWLNEQGFPTNVPFRMKILTYAGYLSKKQHDLALVMEQINQINLNKRGRPKKFVTDGARRAAIFLSAEKSLQRRGHTNLTQTEVINFCKQAAIILKEHGVISDDKLWERSSEKSILDQLPQGFRDLEEFERKCQKISRMTERLSCT